MTINLDYGFGIDYDDQAFLDDLEYGPGTTRYFQRQFATPLDYYTFELGCIAADAEDTDHSKHWNRLVLSQGQTIRELVAFNIRLALESGTTDHPKRVY